MEANDPSADDMPPKTHGMNFSEALALLKEGFKMERSRFIEFDWIEICFIPSETSKITEPYIYMKTMKNQLVPWVPSQLDIMADDWQILVGE